MRLENINEENFTIRLRWLMASRIAIASFILGMAFFLQFKASEFPSEIYLPHLYRVVISTYVLSIIFYFIQKIFDNWQLNIYIQTLCDVFLVTGFVFATGGISSIYAVFYPLVIIYSVVFLGRQGGLIIATVSSIAYGLLLTLEYYGIINPWYVVTIQDYGFGQGYVFSRIFIYALSFYIIALLASFLVEREKKTRTLLAEKETAFDQLDLLHRSIIESVDAGIMTIDLQGNIKSFNTAAQKITGFPLDDVENKDVTEVFPLYMEQATQDYSGGTIKSRFEMVIEGKDKREKIMGCSASPLLGGNKERIGDIIIFQDITSIKEMEDAVEKSRRLAFIGEMAAGLAHEMRNPLASISGSIQLLKRSLLLKETDQRLMEIILRGKDQLENFMRDFLFLARPTFGTSEEFDIREIIDDFLESLRLTPDWNNDIDVHKNLPEGCLINANRKDIRQIIGNLLTNAVQAMPDGGHLKIDSRYLPGDNGNDCQEIIIKDDGYGISQYDLEKIFEPFYTTREKGTGLGLAVVNKIVERYNGAIVIESEEGKGTTCKVRLPAIIRG